MTGSGAWRPLKEPARAPRLNKLTGSGVFVTPFVRLARMHALAVMGDALIAMALAGSLFFSIDPTAARWRVGLYLVLTMAPFAIIAPLIGPVIDRIRGGRRMMLLAAAALRVVVALFMIGQLDTLLLFPAAFGMLVLGKTHHVAKSATVPSAVETYDELVEANAKLSLLSGLSGFAAGVPGLALLWLGGPEWVVGLAVVAFIGATLAATRLAPAVVAEEPPDEIERAELRSTGIVLAASAMSVMRGIVGYLTFLLAFELRRAPDEIRFAGVGVGRELRDLLGFGRIATDSGAPTWHFGVVVGVSVLGGVIGTLVAPRLRRSGTEERMLAGALLLVVAAAVAAIWTQGLFGASIIAGAVGVASTTSKVAFDSIVQRDAPDANQGRSFARFEARFQIAWVIGAFVPVVLEIPAWLGYAVVAAAAGFAAGSFRVGLRALPPVEQPEEREGVAATEATSSVPALQRPPPRLGQRWRRGTREPENEE